MSGQLRNLQDKLSAHMDVILSYFKPGAKITVVVTNSTLTDADVVIGNDDLDEAIAAIERMKTRPPTFVPPTPPEETL